MSEFIMYDTVRDKKTGKVGTVRKVKDARVKVKFPGEKEVLMDANRLLKLNR